MGIQQTKLNPHYYQLTYYEVRDKIIDGSMSVNTIPIQRFFKDTDTYLQYAIKQDDDKFINYLLQNPVDVNFNSQNCTPAIHLAIQKNDKELVKKLLDVNADINLQSQYKASFPDYKLFTPLQLAVDLNNYEIVELLINRGANVNACCLLIDEYSYIMHPSFVIYENAILPNTMHHFTPLHLAVNNENKKIVDLLIENKADIDYSPKYSLFYTSLTSKTALGIAIKKENLNLVKKLVAAGADVNISSWNDYWTPLHLAAELDAREIALYLIKNGANVNAISNIVLGYQTTTPLRVAIKGNHFEMVKLLVENGALINFQVNNLLCPILCCIFTFVRSKKMIDYLLESGADMDFRCHWEEKSTFLHVVASMNDGDLLPFLLTHKYMIDINTVTSKGESVLHKAVHCIYESNTMHLLNAGIDINLVDVDGNTAHDIAYENEKYSYKSMIESHVVKLSAAGIYVSDKNLQTAEGQKYDNLRRECRDIVALMKNTKVVGSNVTYYHLLQYQRDKLANMLKHLDIENNEFFFYANHFSEFTPYSEMLWYRKIMIKQRIQLLKKAADHLCKIINETDLPDTFIRDITDYMSNRELDLLSTS